MLDGSCPVDTRPRLLAMAATGMGISGLTAVARVTGAGGGRPGELSGNGTVLPAITHPLFDVAIKLAFMSAAFPAIDGSPDGIGLEMSNGLFDVLRVHAEVGDLVGKPPCPFNIVRPLPPRVEWHLWRLSVHVPVQCVKVAARQSDTHTVDRVKIIENGEVQFGGKVAQLDPLRRLLQLWHGFVIHNGIRPSWGPNNRTPSHRLLELNGRHSFHSRRSWLSSTHNRAQWWQYLAPCHRRHFDIRGLGKTSIREGDEILDSC